LTVVCHRRLPIFLEPAAADIVAAVLSSDDAWKDCLLLAWVLMPDHWHALVELGEDGNLAKAMHLVKGRSSHALSRATGRPGPLWEPGYHDRALRQDDDVVVAARYVIANPIRAGLVDKAADYRFWGCRWPAEESELD
jgi:REP element-mobilizing transposase RayT